MYMCALIVVCTYMYCNMHCIVGKFGRDQFCEALAKSLTNE